MQSNGSSPPTKVLCNETTMNYIPLLEINLNWSTKSQRKARLFCNANPHALLVNAIRPVDTCPRFGYACRLSGQARRGRTLRTSSGPKGSSDKETFLGAAGLLPGYFYEDYQKEQAIDLFFFLFFMAARPGQSLPPRLPSAGWDESNRPNPPDKYPGSRRHCYGRAASRHQVKWKSHPQAGWQ